MYSAIYLSGDLGTRFRVTSGHSNLDSAKVAVERWCSDRDSLDLRRGEIVVCQAGETTLRSVARFSAGRWQHAEEAVAASAADRDRPVAF